MINIESFISGSFDKWCEEMKKDGIWADHITMMALSKMLKTDLLIVTSSPQSNFANSTIWICGEKNYSGSPILLGHYWENHYQSLEPKGRIIYQFSNYQLNFNQLQYMHLLSYVLYSEIFSSQVLIQTMMRCT